MARLPQAKSGVDVRPAADLFTDLGAIEREVTPLAVRGLILGFRKRLRRRRDRAEAEAPAQDA